MAKLLLTLIVLSLSSASAQNPPVVLDRDGSIIALEPYATNIIRVTLSMNRDQGVAAPGYGFTATPATDGWSQQHDDGGDIYRSAGLIVTVAGEPSTETRGDPNRYRQVLQRVQSAGQHFGANARGQDTAANDALVDVRSQSQERQRGNPERQASVRFLLLSSWCHLCFAR